MLLEHAPDVGVAVDDARLEHVDYDGYASADAARLAGFLDRNRESSFGLDCREANPGALLQLA